MVQKRIKQIDKQFLSCKHESKEMIKGENIDKILKKCDFCSKTSSNDQYFVCDNEDCDLDICFKC